MLSRPLTLATAVALLVVGRAGASVVLHSLPGASHTLYLDLDGEPAANWFGLAVPVTPAFTGDGAALWASAERAYADPHVIAADGTIRVAAPLDLDVTTAAPAGPLIAGRDVEVIVGGRGEWYGNGTAGGGAYVGSFADATLPRTAYVFPDAFGDEATFSGEAVAHEAGHAFGLDHPDGGYVYGLWMGAPFGADPPVWSEAEYARLAGELGVVPEPGAVLAIAGVGGVTLAGIRRRRSESLCQYLPESNRRHLDKAIHGCRD